MSDKRYFKRMWEEEYYIFDSNTISESDFKEKLEYQNYKAFEDSMMGDEVVNRLNELHEENQSFEIHSKWQGEKYSELLDSFTNMKKKLQLVKKENEELKQRINNRLHYYRELYNHFDKNDGFSYNIVERVVEDLEDILR